MSNKYLEMNYAELQGLYAEQVLKLNELYITKEDCENLIKGLSSSLDELEFLLLDRGYK